MPLLDPDENHQDCADDQSKRGQNNIDRYRVVVEHFMVGGIDQWLAQIDHAAEADNCAIDPAECCKAEDFRGVIADASISWISHCLAEHETYDIAE